MEAVVDTGFSLQYRDTVLRFLFPLFPQPSAKGTSSHVPSLIRLLVTLSDSSLTVPLFVSLVPKEKLLAYQFAFDLVEGGARDYLEIVRNELPAGDEVGARFSCRASGFPPVLLPEYQRNLRQDQGYTHWARFGEALSRIPQT